MDVGTNIKKPIFITLFKDFMNITTIIIGLLPITYGLYILSLRLRNKMDKLGKIESMKGFYGKKLWSIIHFIAYVVVPISFGVMIIIAGVNGTNIIDMFARS